MICIEMPLWLAILIIICFCSFLIHLLIGDLIIKLIYKKYNLELKEKEENKNDEH